MAKQRNSRRIRKQRVPKLEKLALSITTPEQARHGLREVDVANFSDADVKDADSLKRLKTVRKLTRVELLTRAGVITPDQALACEWYLTAYELGYQTVGCTANYLGAGGGGFGASDLLSRYKAQGEARENYLYAKQAIPEYLIGLFDRVVLGPLDIRTLTKEERLRFSLAAFLLHGQIGHLLAIAA
jgi:hypothetical protein